MGDEIGKSQQTPVCGVLFRRGLRDCVVWNESSDFDVERDSFPTRAHTHTLSS